MPRKVLFLAVGIAFVAAIAYVINTPRPTSMKPDFDSALNAHFAAIANRDIEAFKSHLSLGDTLYTVVQNGHAFKSPAETIAIHDSGLRIRIGHGKAQWFIRSWGRTWRWLSCDKPINPTSKPHHLRLGSFTFSSCRKARGESSTTRIQHWTFMLSPMPQGSRSSRLKTYVTGWAHHSNITANQVVQRTPDLAPTGCPASDDVPNLHLVRWSPSILLLSLEFLAAATSTLSSGPRRFRIL